MGEAWRSFQTHFNFRFVISPAGLLILLDWGDELVVLLWRLESLISLRLDGVVTRATGCGISKCFCFFDLLCCSRLGWVWVVVVGVSQSLIDAVHPIGVSRRSQPLCLKQKGAGVVRCLTIHCEAVGGPAAGRTPITAPARPCEPAEPLISLVAGPKPTSSELPPAAPPPLSVDPSTKSREPSTPESWHSCLYLHHGRALAPVWILN